MRRWRWSGWRSRAATPRPAPVLLRAAAAARERAAARPNEALAETLPLLRRVVETHPTEEALAVLERQATRAGEWPLAILARRQLAEAAPTP